MPDTGVLVEPVDPKQADAAAAAAPSQTESPPAEVTPPELPEKYRGKTVAEVAEMHQNAEKKIGQQANEVGIWRELVDDMATIKRKDDLTKTQTTPEPTVYDADEFLTKPVEMTQQMINEAIAQVRAETKEESNRTLADTEMARFETDFPNWREISQSTEFSDWGGKDPSRVEDARRAVQENDVLAARRLMTGFNQETATPTTTEQIVAEPTAPTGLDGAASVATEVSGNAGTVSAPEILYENDVINTRNNNPDLYYSASYQEKLMESIKSGNYKR